MLDINYIRKNKQAVVKAALQKNLKVDIDKLLELDEEIKDIKTKLNHYQEERNLLAKKNKSGKPSREDVQKGRDLKEKIAQLEDDLRDKETAFERIMVKVPTIPSKDTPVGRDDSENVEIYRWKEPAKFDFKPKSYIELGRDLDLLDLERGVKVSGYRGYYVKNEGVLLQMGLMMYALRKLIQKGFMPMIPPTLVREFVLFGSGYFAGKDFDPKVDEIYKIENFDKEADGTVKKESKFLIGTAEPSLLAYYADEVLAGNDLPKKICGFSQCYRSEIGSYGKDTKGIYRVHEFMKVEQVCLCHADVKEANKMHEEMVDISKELHEDLDLPYRQLQICTGDMSPGKYKMFDMEVWIPSRKGYGESGSASNFLDWQSRRLNVRYKDKQGEKKYVYMLNNTALPSARILIAVLENYQQKDGSILVPEVLKEYVGKDVIKPKTK
ncbi:MAG: serine--tRNA ligase [Candidatus Moranbacteria bacterium]|nr:serine--tRNA ligase [Candidatus Moranbacteria bacterium]